MKKSRRNSFKEPSVCNFVATADIQSGDFIPIADIEKEPRENVQNMERLREEL